MKPRFQRHSLLFKHMLCVFSASLLFMLLLSSCATEFKPAHGQHVPQDLKEAYLELDRMFPNELKTSLKVGETKAEDLLLTWGLQIKEYWGLWKDSKLAKFMRKNDIEHPDQMVFVIFEGYVDYIRKPAVQPRDE